MVIGPHCLIQAEYVHHIIQLLLHTYPYIQGLTVYSLIDVLLYVGHVLCKMEKETNGSQNHTTVGVLETVIEDILGGRIARY